MVAMKEPELSCVTLISFNASHLCRIKFVVVAVELRSSIPRPIFEGYGPMDVEEEYCPGETLRYRYRTLHLQKEAYQRPGTCITLSRVTSIKPDTHLSARL